MNVNIKSIHIGEGHSRGYSPLTTKSKKKLRSHWHLKNQKNVGKIVVAV